MLTELASNSAQASQEETNIPFDGSQQPEPRDLASEVGRVGEVVVSMESSTLIDRARAG